MKVCLRLKLCLCIVWLCAALTGLQVHASEKPWLDQLITPEDMRHLLARTGFDAAHESQQQLAGLTRRDAIDLLIAGLQTRPSMPMPAWTTNVAPLYWAYRDLDDEQQRQFNRTRDAELSELRNWWIDEMLTTPSPQTERMVLFWHDHFATSYHSIGRRSIAMARQNQTFREMGMGEFETLLKAMIRDPALLYYLDNTSNNKTKPNENMARELLELFTLGEGNYKEATVREAARALTGYSVSRNNNLQARFNEWQHDSEQKTLFGETGNFDADNLIELIMQQPALDRYIAAKYWHWLVADREPAEKELEPLAEAFRASGHNLGELYRSTLESEAFWRSQNRGGLIKSPATLLIGTARTLGYSNGINKQLPRLLKLTGQDLFVPPNVAGWQEGAAWITPGRLLNRYSALEELLAATQEPWSQMTPSEEPVSMSMNNAFAQDTEASGADVMATEMNMEEVTHLTLQLAAEEYEGPVHYRVDLLDSDHSVTWSTDEQVLANGWDTERYGKVDSRDQLPWTGVRLSMESSLFASGDTLRVFFMNDAAGGNGDRNMYVNTLQTNGYSVLPTPGSQTSNCPPANSADTGDMYCAGYIDFDVQALQAMGVSDQIDATQQKRVRYASKHIEWANEDENNGNANVRLVFQDVRFGQRYWPVFSVRYRFIGEKDLALWLNNQDCWEDCIESWPACAWTNNQDPIGRTIAIPAMGVKAGGIPACHVAGLNDDEAAMVDSLLIQGSDLLQQALSAETIRFPSKRDGVKKGLNKLISELDQPAVQRFFAQSSPTGRTALQDVPEWVQSNAARRPYPNDQIDRALIAPAHDLTERHEQIMSAGFTLPSVLAPGIALIDLPGWSATSDSRTAPGQLYEQARSLLLKPAYQVQ